MFVFCILSACGVNVCAYVRECVHACVCVERMVCVCVCGERGWGVLGGGGGGWGAAAGTERERSKYPVSCTRPFFCPHFHPDLKTGPLDTSLCFLPTD